MVVCRYEPYVMSRAFRDPGGVENRISCVVKVKEQMLLIDLGRSARVNMPRFRLAGTCEGSEPGLAPGPDAEAAIM